MSERTRVALLAALAGVALGIASASAEEGGGARVLDPAALLEGGGEAVATEIRADTLLLDRLKRILVYEGSVRARRGPARLSCDRLAVRYAEDQSIDDAQCEGHVRFAEGARQGRADAARYERAREYLTMTGAVTVEDGLNRVSGDRIDVELDIERVSAWGSEGRPACTRFASADEGGEARSAPSAPDADDADAHRGELGGIDQLWSSEDGPVEVCARRTLLENRDGRLRYAGEVEAVQGDSRMRCEELELRYGEDRRVRDGSCIGDAEIVRGEVVATAREAHLDGERQIVRLTDRVRVFEEGAEVQAARAVVMLEEDRVVLEGTGTDPVITVVEQEARTEPTEAAEEPPGDETRVEDPFGILSAATREPQGPDPLRVRSYWLQARRGACAGLYRGDVVARHRGVTMESDELEVFCDEETNQVTEIEARDDVRISNLEGVATADRAHYSASTQRLVLSGEDVAFQRAKQATLRCTEMIFDRATNQMWCRSKRTTDRTVLKVNTEDGEDVPTGGILE